MKDFYNTTILKYKTYYYVSMLIIFTSHYKNKKKNFLSVTKNSPLKLKLGNYLEPNCNMSLDLSPFL
jgi:hypothetical protein